MNGYLGGSMTLVFFVFEESLFVVTNLSPVSPGRVKLGWGGGVKGLLKSEGGCVITQPVIGSHVGRW